MLRYLWRAFVEAFREAKADARRGRPLTLERPGDSRLERLQSLLPKKLDRSLDSAEVHSNNTSSHPS